MNLNKFYFVGIHYWRLGFERREENIKRILNNLNVKDGETIETYKKKIAKPNSAYNYSKEFNSIEELEQIIPNVDEVRMQSLLIRERILGQTHVDTTYYIRFRGAVYADSGELFFLIFRIITISIHIYISIIKKKFR